MTEIQVANSTSPFDGAFSYEDSEQRSFNGIPILVRDYNSITSQIDEAKSLGRVHWYEESHLNVWQGPYRHHLLKRKIYVESVLNTYCADSKVESLLDLGCGDGANLKWLKQYANNLYGSDYNIIRLLRAKNLQLAREVVLADATDYPAKDNSFDIIFFNHVLEHISDDVAALSQVHRILKNGGVCILGVPNEGSFWWQLAYKLQPSSLKQTDHVQFYTIDSLSEKIKGIGFKIREVKSLGWGLPHWYLDSKVRGYKIIDDLFESIGKIIMPHQASSLYFIIEK